MKCVALVVVAACGNQAPPDVVGPFTGEVHRYVVDRFTVPMSNNDARDFGEDLDGDPEHQIDNQFGSAVGILGGTGDITTHGGDMIAAGVIASWVEIQADDLTDDPSVSVTYFGADGEDTIWMGGSFVDGAFRSNRTATTRVPGHATIHLPVFADADPVVLPLDGMEIDLAPDGNGGYIASIRGGFPGELAYDAATAGMVQMIVANPSDHFVFVKTLDPNHDGILTSTELDTSTVLRALLLPDLQLFIDGRYAPQPEPEPRDADSLSAGFRVHLIPCASGSCVSAPPVDLCHDRVLDQDESDVDCGGTSCPVCAPTRACRAGSDCDSGACDSGACRAASCLDHRRDGFERDVDCGGYCEFRCLGDECSTNSECLSDHCGTGDPRVCIL